MRCCYYLCEFHTLLLVIRCTNIFNVYSEKSRTYFYLFLLLLTFHFLGRVVYDSPIPRRRSNRIRASTSSELTSAPAASSSPVSRFVLGI